MRPTALVGLARRVIASSMFVVPSSVNGRWLTISSTTWSRRASSWSTTPTMVTRTIVERHEREEDAIRDAGSVLREAVAEVAVDRHGHGPHEVLDDPQGPPRHAHPEGPLLGGGCLGHSGGV